MGKISSSEPQQKETTATHFSHPHPLKLINYNHPTHNASPCCSGCKLKPSGTVYSCTLCSDFLLHKRCFEMPKTISHPFHKEHPFTLLPSPAYEEGLFNCDACAETGDGFSYHCKPCGIDLHILCAAMPLTLTTAYHPHKLDLAFGSPYDTKNFACDVCKLQGSDHWLYRCNSCGFDAHLKCARHAPPQQQQAVPQPQVHGVPYFGAATGSRSIPMPQPLQGQGVPYFGAPPMQQQQGFAPHNMMMNINPAVGFPAMTQPAFGVNRAPNEVFQQAIQQIIQNQTMLGGVGNNSVQQLMQLMSNGGIPGGGFNAFGGGGGGGLASLQSLMGGGGGLSSLQSLLGGGGGLDSLQSLLGGGGGLDLLGGGGLDLLGGLGGLF